LSVKVNKRPVKVLKRFNQNNYSKKIRKRTIATDRNKKPLLNYVISIALLLIPKSEFDYKYRIKYGIEWQLKL
jgi:hypothetical protein